MCRNNEHGGRRCPAHTDPVRIAAYNAVRRARYQARKQGGEHATAAVFDITKVRTAPTGVELNKHQATTVAFEAALTDAEKQALIDYTEFDYEDIRDMLTGFHVKTQQPLSFDEEEQARIKQQIEHIDAALAKNQNKLPRKLYRGMRINRHIPDPSAWVQENFKPGSTFSQPGYMSTSLSPFKAAEFGATVMDDGSRGVIIEILSKEGAVLGDQSSSFGFGEQEVLIPRDHQFEVVAVHERVEFKYDYFADDEGFDDLDDDEPFTVIKTVIQVIDKQA